MDGVANRLPLFDRRVILQLLGKQYGAVEGNPRHHFRIGELLRSAPYLPDSMIGMLPDFLKMVEQKRQHAEIVFIVPFHGVLRMKERIEHFAENIELQLRGCSVADAHRLRFLVTSQPVDLPLDELLLAIQPIHDLYLVGASGQRAQQPILPRFCFLKVAGVHQRQQRKCCVAQPAIPVIPVTCAADMFG